MLTLASQCIHKGLAMSPALEHQASEIAGAPAAYDAPPTDTHQCAFDGLLSHRRF